jgi:hypothetical protein
VRQVATALVYAMGRFVKVVMMVLKTKEEGWGPG